MSTPTTQFKDRLTWQDDDVVVSPSSEVDATNGPTVELSTFREAAFHLPGKHIDLALLAAADVQTGAMIALLPSEPDLDRLAVDGGEPRDQLHLTLWYLGDAAAWDEAQRAALIGHVRAAATSLTVIRARAFGVDLWNPDGDNPAWVLAVGDDPEAGGDGLDMAHDATSPHRVSDPSTEAGAVSVPAQHTPWVPHVCLDYSADPARLEELATRLGPVTFDRVRVAFAGTNLDISLGGGTAVTEISTENTAIFHLPGQHDQHKHTGMKKGPKGTVEPVELLKVDNNTSGGYEEVHHATRGRIGDVTEYEYTDYESAPGSRISHGQRTTKRYEAKIAPAHAEGKRLLKDDGHKMKRDAIDWLLNQTRPADEPRPPMRTRYDATVAAMVTDAGAGDGADVRTDDRGSLPRQLLGNEGGSHAVTETLTDSPSVDQETFGGDPNPGTRPDRRLAENNGNKKKNKDDKTKDDKTKGPHTKGRWRGTIVVEGVRTGDGREFSADSLTWANPPLALQWQKVSSHGGNTDVTVRVGNIDRVWREGNQILGSGRFDLGSEDGAEAFRRLEEGFLKGISIASDDIGDADVELVWPETAPDSEVDEASDTLVQLFGRPEATIFHKGRIRAATLCDIPAFVDAYVELVADDDATVETAGEPGLTAGAVGVHTTATTDGAWNHTATHDRLSTAPLPLATAKAAYAYVDQDAVRDGVVAAADCRLPHHEVGEDGAVGAANLTACAAIIGGLHAATGVPASARRGVYEHAAAHLRAAGQEPPPLESLTLAASLVANARVDNWTPNRAWFEDPRLNQLVPIIVTAEGRVYGHAAQWGECHLSFGDRCVLVPQDDDFTHFATGTIPGLPDIPVGQILADIPHANTMWSAARASQHYDNTDCVVADVAVGNDRHGVWVAGAIRPWAAARRVHALQASGQLSPDWRWIGGRLRMVGLLTVTVSGFQVPQPRAGVHDGQLQSLVACGIVPLGGAAARTAEQRALRAIVDQLSTQVHGGPRAAQ